MQKIIDSNQLQTPQLHDYLSKSPSNFAVLPDFVAMEAYKGETLKSVYKAMSVLSHFPRQVVILKGSATICGMQGRIKGLQRRLIDQTQTKDFPKYIRDLRLAENGNTCIQAEILSHGKYANEHLEKMLNDAISIRGTVEELCRQFTKDERTHIRSENWLIPGLIEKIIRMVFQLVASIFKESPIKKSFPAYEELPNTFIFRVAFTFFLMGLRKFADGALDNLNPKKFRNDFVDMIFVAYGTFFDGVMSSDKNVIFMSATTNRLLRKLFDAHIPSHKS